MPVVVKDQQDTYNHRTYFPSEEHAGKSTLKVDKQVTPPKPTSLKEEKSLICTKNSQTIESLLPDEEDLFFGVLDELGFTYSTTTVNGDDEDFDLFSSSGGMEMEENSKLCFTQQNPAIAKGLNNTNQIQISLDFSIPCEHHTFHHQSQRISHEGFYNMLNPYIPQMEHIFPNLHGLSKILLPVFSFSPIHKQHTIKIEIRSPQSYMEESCKPDLIPVASPNSMMSSPHIIKAHKSPKREIENTLPLSFIKPRGRTRRTSHGRHETVSCHTHTDDKNYELDIERVLCGIVQQCCWLQLVNIIKELMISFICLLTSRKLYMCNMGYAFINMIDPLQIVQLHKSFHGKKWEKFHSEKAACLAYGRNDRIYSLIFHKRPALNSNKPKLKDNQSQIVNHPHSPRHIDLKGWGVDYVSSFQQHCLLQMLNSVAGLREYFAHMKMKTSVYKVDFVMELLSKLLSKQIDDA
uniref:Mei2-like C-terminal RNA recognition motif domain-containing protein n=1 Tax=Lactuca sativa TaxID=4236 RepID=A0A9R1XLZ7_LACSA|nr:hypothetical protein LSAT_V11C300140160 [Lactuca sativa]